MKNLIWAVVAISLLALFAAPEPPRAFNVVVAAPQDEAEAAEYQAQLLESAIADQVDPSVVESWMPLGISVVVLLAGLWVILSGKYQEETYKWATGAIGTVIGYWLNT